MNRYARQFCEGRAFAEYVGVRAALSRYRVALWAPNQSSWDAGDRRIACAAYADGTLGGSVRGTKR